MGKKNLGGLDSLIGGETPTTSQEPVKKKVGRPRTQIGGGTWQLSEDETRASIIAQRDLWAKFKALVYWDRRTQKGLMNQMLTEFLTNWEKKNGKIKPIPADAEAIWTNWK